MNLMIPDGGRSAGDTEVRSIDVDKLCWTDASEVSGIEDVVGGTDNTGV